MKFWIENYSIIILLVSLVLISKELVIYAEQLLGVGGEEVDGEDALEVGEVGFEHAAQQGDAGAVDQDIDGAELGGAGFDGGGVGEVEVWQVEADDFGAVGGEEGGDGGADAAAMAGDDGAAAGQAEGDAGAHGGRVAVAGGKGKAWLIILIS